MKTLSKELVLEYTFKLNNITLVYTVYIPLIPADIHDDNLSSSLVKKQEKYKLKKRLLIFYTSNLQTVRMPQRPFLATREQGYVIKEKTDREVRS